MSKSEGNAAGGGSRMRIVLAALPLAVFIALALIFWTHWSRLHALASPPPENASGFPERANEADPSEY